MASNRDDDPVNSIGEERIIKDIFLKGRNGGSSLEVGPGDDCAVFSPSGRKLAISTDMLVEDVHFDLDYFPPRALGRKCVNVNVSDLAAMGARPHSAYLSIGIDPSTKIGFLRKLAGGLRKSLRDCGMVLAGGDTVRAEKLILSLTVVGILTGPPVTRSGAEEGDLLYLSGHPGRSHIGMCLLKEGIKGRGPWTSKEMKIIKTHLHPPIDVKLGVYLREKGIATAMIDTSDGLIPDLRRILTASGVGAEIDLPSIPADGKMRNLIQTLDLSWEDVALFGGEDYLLLFTVKGKKKGVLERWGGRSRPYMIGRISGRKGIRVRGGTLSSIPAGVKNPLFLHFDPEERKVN